MAAIVRGVLEAASEVEAARVLRVNLSIGELTLLAEDQLRTAFSVRGVPAMVIETAVPEIEAEANRLLERMTGGRMRVRFDTQRKTHSQSFLWVIDMTHLLYP